MSSRRRTFLNEAEKHMNPPMRTEFKCPLCGGVSSVWIENSLLAAECHACSIMVKKGAGNGKDGNTGK